MQRSLFDLPESDEVLVPDFLEVGLDIEAAYCCPSCNYEWSGSAGSVDDVMRSGSKEEFDESEKYPDWDYKCPKCARRWSGKARAGTSQRGALGFGETTQQSARMVKRVEKPPYRVPSMKEIEALPWNGYNVVSTFSGCGGSCLGYRMAGFRVLWASEFIPEAQKTYRANHPNSILDTRDIRKVTAEDILAATGLRRGELDVFDGSPPCASFSTAGKREKGWGKVKKYSDTEQRTDDLFLEYIRLIDGLRPKVFVAENVSGLTKGTAKGWFLDIMTRLRALGYRVRVKILDAAWLGVPQSRQRTIFIGVRDDLVGADPSHPSPLPYQYSVRDALPWVDRVVHDTSGQFSVGEVTDRPCPAITIGVNSLNSSHYQAYGPKPTDAQVAEASIEKYAIGAEWEKTPVGGASEKFFQLVRPDPEKPCPTITQTAGNVGAAGVTHPFEKRKFTIGELRRICGFPDDFILTGSYAQQWERLGRAVPPVMMAAVARTVKEKILDRIAEAGAPIEPAHPEPLPYQHTLQDACPNIVDVGNLAHGFTRENEIVLDRPAPTLATASAASTYYGHYVIGAPLQPGEVDGDPPCAE
jgi:DNA (cytosine-5)-methyltransferase 1